MPPVRSSSFRNRQKTIKMQSQTTEFAGCRYPTSQLLLLDRSPTATPVQTRSGSPTRGDVLHHTVEDATEFMTKLNHIKKPTMSSEPVAAETHTGSKGPIALAELDEKLVLKSVSATDGSAAVSTSTKVKYLIVYFAFNLGLTLFNKAVMIAVCVCADVLFRLLFDFICRRSGRGRAYVFGYYIMFMWSFGPVNARYNPIFNTNG